MGASTGSRSLQGIGDSKSYWFKNFAKNSYDLRGPDADLYPAIFDKDSYPTFAPPNNVGLGCNIPPNYSGNWVISFDGVGDLLFQVSTTIVQDVDGCVVPAGGNTRITSNAASEARGRTRVIVNFAPGDAVVFAYIAGSIKYSNVGGAAPNQKSSMSNLVFCRCSSPYGNGGTTPAGDELAIQSGDLTQAFNDDTLAIYSTLNFKIGRMMGIVQTNFDHVTSQNSTRWPLTGVSWIAPRWDPTAWVGVTSGSNSAYTCPAAPGMSGAFVAGEMLQLQFHANQAADLALSGITVTPSLLTFAFSSAHGLATNDFIFIYIPSISDAGQGHLAYHYKVTVTDPTHCTITPLLAGGAFAGSYSSGGFVCKAPTINPGGRGARPIVDDDGFSPEDFFSPYGPIVATTLATLSYDADIDAWAMKRGAIPNSISVEVAVAFMNKLNKDLWWNFPISLTVAAAVEQAIYIRDHLNPGLNAYFEGSNEIWNFGFTQFHYNNQKSVRMGFISSGGSFWELLLARYFNAIGAIWSGSVGLKRVTATQVGQGDIAGNGSWAEHLLLSPSLNSTTTPSYTGTNYSVVGKRVTDQSEVLSYAPYYQASQTATYAIFPGGLSSAADIQGLLTAADNFAAGGAGITTALNWLDDNVRQGTLESRPITIATDGTCTMSADPVSFGIYDHSVVQLFVSGGALPSPLVPTVFGAPQAGHLYWVRDSNATAHTFKLAATQFGAAIAGLTGGSGTFSVGLTYGNMSFTLQKALPDWDSLAVTYNKEVSCYENGQSSWYPLPSDCTALGISTAYAQKILNLIAGVGGYQQSAQFQATCKYQMDQFMTGIKSAHPAQLQVVGENQWSLLQGYNPPDASVGQFPGDITCAHNASFASVVAFNSEGTEVTFGGRHLSKWQQTLTKHSIKEAAVELGRRGGLARAQTLTANQRSSIAATAAKARWR